MHIAAVICVFRTTTGSVFFRQGALPAELTRWQPYRVKYGPVNSVTSGSRSRCRRVTLGPGSSDYGLSRNSQGTYVLLQRRALRVALLGEIVALLAQFLD